MEEEKRQGYPQITLAAARVNAGLSQVEAAEKLGVSFRSLIRYEKGRTRPTDAMLEKMAEVYGFPLEYIRL